MGKKATIITSVAALALVGGGVAAAVVIAQQDNTKFEPARRVSSFSEFTLRKAWQNANNYIKEHHVTVSSVDQKDANFDVHRDGIYEAVASTPIADGTTRSATLRSYISKDNVNFTQNLANLTFKIKPGMISNRLDELTLDSGYIKQTSDSISLNNLALSSPDSYFKGTHGSKGYDRNSGVVVGLSELGEKEPDILIPDGCREIAIEAFKGTTTIENFIMPDTLTKLGQQFFNNQHTAAESQLKYVKFSRGLSLIPELSFCDNHLLAKVDMYEGIEKIEGFAFSNNNFTGTIVLPTTLLSLEEDSITYLSNSITLVTWANQLGKNFVRSADGKENVKHSVYLMGKSNGYYNSNQGNAFTWFNNIYCQNQKIKEDIEKLVNGIAPKPNVQIKNFN